MNIKHIIKMLSDFNIGKTTFEIKNNNFKLVVESEVLGKKVFKSEKEYCDFAIEAIKRYSDDAWLGNDLKSLVSARFEVQSVLATMLDISPTSLSLKLNGRNDFTRSEIAKLITILDIPENEVLSVFFT